MILNGRDKIEVSFSTDCSRAGRHDITDKVGGQAAIFGQGQAFYDPDTKSYISGN
jgi:hypothetical protein